MSPASAVLNGPLVVLRHRSRNPQQPNWSAKTADATSPVPYLHNTSRHIRLRLSSPLTASLRVPAGELCRCRTVQRLTGVAYLAPIRAGKFGQAGHIGQRRDTDGRDGIGKQPYVCVEVDDLAEYRKYLQAQAPIVEKVRKASIGTALRSRAAPPPAASRRPALTCRRTPPRRRDCRQSDR